MQICIVGAGIGGLGLALALARSGHQVQLLEQAAAIQGVGAGIQIGANGCRILHHWGLLDALRERASCAPFGWLGDGLSGRKLCTFPLSRFAEQQFGFPHLHVHRADLQDLLLRACQSESNIRIELGARLVALEQSRSGVKALVEKGKGYDSDLLVGADGMRSSVARLGLHRNAARFSGRVAWRALVDVRELAGRPDISKPGIWLAPGKHLVHYPLRGGTLLNLVACSNHPEAVPPLWHNAADSTEFRTAFADLAAPLAALLDPLESSYRWGLYQSDWSQPWWKGRIVLLGDAAHAMLPSMAQGAVMALEDAAVLAVLLEHAPIELDAALHRYQSLRLPRVAAIQRVAEQNMQTFHQPRGMLRTMRLGGMHLLGSRGDQALGQVYKWVYDYDALAATLTT